MIRTPTTREWTARARSRTMFGLLLKLDCHA